MVGNRRKRFSVPEEGQPRTGRSSQSKGVGISEIGFDGLRRGRRGAQRSGGRGGVPQGLGSGGRGQGGQNPTLKEDQLSFPPRGKLSGRNPAKDLGFPRRRQPQRPTNPHDPRSKDPFMRAGIGLGTNDTKIFTRAGMSMDLKKMRKMF